MRHRYEDIERTHPRRCEGGIGHARMLHIKRGVVGQDVVALNGGQIPLVVGTQVNRVVREVVIPAAQPEIEHKG